MTIGEYIKQKRQEKNISTYKLAKDLNMATRNIQRWEENESMPNAKYIFLLIDYLDLDITEVKKLLYQDL